MSFPDFGLYCSFILPLLFCVLLLVLKWQVMIFMYFAGMSSGGLSLPIGVAFFLGFYFVSVTSFVGRLQCQHVPLCIALNPRPGIGVVFAVCLKDMWIFVC